MNVAVMGDSESINEWRPLSMQLMEAESSSSLIKYELLILNKLNDDSAQWHHWKQKLQLSDIEADCSVVCDEHYSQWHCHRSHHNPDTDFCEQGTDRSSVRRRHARSTCVRHSLHTELRHLSTFSSSSSERSRPSSTRMSDALVLVRLSSKMSSERLGSQNWTALRNIMSQCDEDTLHEMAKEGNDLNNVTGWWYIDMYKHLERKERLLDFFVKWANHEKEIKDPYHSPTPFNSMLHHYIQQHQFTELYLDTAFRSSQSLPLEIFLCSAVRVLSLRDNLLESVPPDVGRLADLEQLLLTANRLELRSLPRTLTFCKRLRRLTLDHNLLDALPGFLLEMTSLETVHRHGNHNYFKATFMWYHTDSNGPERIVHCPGWLQDFMPPEPNSLNFLAAQAFIGTGVNFYSSRKVPFQLKQYISSVYRYFDVCDYCKKAVLVGSPGYRVITFKSPWLGNSCVPFQHWTCCAEHAVTLEHPARKEQALALRQQDMAYRRYVNQCQSELEPEPAESTSGCLSLLRPPAARLTLPRLGSRRGEARRSAPSTSSAADRNENTRLSRQRLALNCANCAIM